MMWLWTFVAVACITQVADSVAYCPVRPHRLVPLRLTNAHTGHICIVKPSTLIYRVHRREPLEYHRLMEKENRAEHPYTLAMHRCMGMR